jgi:hypothetical protein
VASLSRGRVGHCCVALGKHHLYVMGGGSAETKGRPIATVEVYDSRLDVWEVMPQNMVHARREFAACTCAVIISALGCMCKCLHSSDPTLWPANG